MTVKPILLILVVSVFFLAFASCERKTDLAKEHVRNQKQVRVDIFYLPHPPAMAIVRNVEDVLKKYAEARISEYDFYDPKNAQRIEAHGIRYHSPIVIFINDKNSFTFEGRTVEFKNFPKGDAFVPSLEGSWTYDDIGKAIGKEIETE